MSLKINTTSILISGLAFFLLAFQVSASTATSAVQNQSNTEQTHSEVISAFTAPEESSEVKESDTNIFRHKLLFFMGVTLLLFVFATAYFGMSMALFGKQVFVPHMICAGITVFLAMAHSVVAVVWFFPF